MKPITYWIQNDAINQLVDKYGSCFEALPPDTRRDLISYLAVPDEWNWGTAYGEEWDTLAPQIETLTRHEKDLLIEAIAATLTHQGNPWVESARKMAAIEHALEPKE